MFFNQEHQSQSHRKRLKTKFVFNDNISENSSPNTSASTELNSKNNLGDFLPGMNPILSDRKTSQSTSPNKQSRLGQSLLNPTIKPEQEQQNIHSSRKFLSLIPTNPQTHNNEYFTDNKDTRSSFQQPEFQRNKKIYSFTQINNSQINSSFQDRGFFQINTELNNNSKELNHEYFSPIKLQQDNSSYYQNKSTMRLNGNKNDFFESQNQSPLIQPYNTRQNVSQKSLNNLINQDNQSPPFNSDLLESPTTRIKSLSNLSQAFKKIEEIEVNTNISNINLQKKNDDSNMFGKFLKIEQNKSIQFAKRLSKQEPNMNISPLDLLKKQPSKGVLKNHIKLQLSQSSQISVQDQSEDEDITRKKIVSMSNNAQQKPSSLDQIPEISTEAKLKYSSQNDMNQQRVKRIIRNGQVIKKVMNDSYNPNQEFQKNAQQSENQCSPTIKVNMKETSTTQSQPVDKLEQSDDLNTKNIFQSKKRKSRIQIIAGIN